jgi:hypothetical protein
MTDPVTKAKFPVSSDIWYTRREAAQAIGCGTSSLVRWEQLGRLSVSRVNGPGSKTLISGRAILAMLGDATQ